MLVNEYLKNRSRFPLEELTQYEGRHVAWSLDGRRILASDKDPLKMIAKLQAAGFTSADCVLSFVDLDS